MTTARYNHTATLLPNATVLAAGGANNAGLISGAEVYDPVAGMWTATGSLPTPLQNHAAGVYVAIRVLGPSRRLSVPRSSAVLHGAISRDTSIA